MMDNLDNDYSDEQIANDWTERRIMEEEEDANRNPTQLEIDMLCLSDFVTVPDQAFLCPITKTLMEEPVVAADGYTYENGAILTWINDPLNNSSSPMTNLEMSNDYLVPNLTMQSMIWTFKEKHPDIMRVVTAHNKVCAKANEELKNHGQIDQYVRTIDVLKNQILDQRATILLKNRQLVENRSCINIERAKVQALMENVADLTDNYNVVKSQKETLEASNRNSVPNIEIFNVINLMAVNSLNIQVN